MGRGTNDRISHDVSSDVSDKSISQTPEKVNSKNSISEIFPDDFPNSFLFSGAFGLLFLKQIVSLKNTLTHFVIEVFGCELKIERNICKSLICGIFASLVCG